MDEMNFTTTKFAQLYDMVKSEDVEKDYKNLSYISWATAWKYLMLVDPSADYRLMEKPDGGIVWKEYDTLMIRLILTAFGREFRITFPLMDNRHMPIKVEALNSRVLNDNIMRALAKAIALTGLGLPLYVGEDIEDIKAETASPKQQSPSKPTEAEQPKVLCKKCGNLITGNGKLSASQVIAGTIKAYKEPLCAECGKERKSEQHVAEETQEKGEN